MSANAGDPPPTPPASQDLTVGNRRRTAPAAGAAPPRPYACYADLSAAEKTMCDDLIVKLADLAVLPMELNDETRAKFWRRVFRGWDTDDKVEFINGGPPNRNIGHSSMRVGTLKEAAPSGTSSSNSPSSPKRNRDGSLKVDPRSAGQPVLIRPSLHRGSIRFGIHFDLVDKQGKVVPHHIVQFDEGMTEEIAIRQALEHYDRKEADRVNEWNLSVMTAWARHRLRSQLGHVDRTSRAAADLRQSAAAPRGENEAQLAQRVSAHERYEAARALFIAVQPRPEASWDAF